MRMAYPTFIFLGSIDISIVEDVDAWVALNWGMLLLSKRRKSLAFIPGRSDSSFLFFFILIFFSRPPARPPSTDGEKKENMHLAGFDRQTSLRCVGEIQVRHVNALGVWMNGTWPFPMTFDFDSLKFPRTPVNIQQRQCYRAGGVSKEILWVQ